MFESTIPYRYEYRKQNLQFFYFDTSHLFLPELYSAVLPQKSLKFHFRRLFSLETFDAVSSKFINIYRYIFMYMYMNEVSRI